VMRFLSGRRPGCQHRAAAACSGPATRPGADRRSPEQGMEQGAPGREAGGSGRRRRRAHEGEPAMSTGRRVVDQVVVIGAGPSGLSTAAELLARDVPTVVLDRGGAGAAWASRYDSLR